MDSPKVTAIDMGLPLRLDRFPVPSVAGFSHRIQTACRRGVCLGDLVGLLATEHPALASLTDSLTPENPILDMARVIPEERRQPINDSLIQFEQTTGWRIRLLSAYQGASSLSESDIREAWKPNDKTVIVAVDPSSPNIVAFRYIGDTVQEKLGRPFWIELQSRFGNLFFVRQRGEYAAVEGILGSIEDCLARQEGCRVVPGLSSDQFFATLAVSVAGGLVLGFASRFEQGNVTQRLKGVLLFSPLWIIFFVNLGLGPIVSRTDDRWPVVADTAAFLGVASIFQFLEFPPRWMQKEDDV